MPFEHHTNERGHVFAANGATAFIPSDNDALAGLPGPMAGFTDAAQKAEALIKPEALAAHLLRTTAMPLLAATSAAIDAAARQARETGEADQRARMVPPTVDMSHAGEIRSIYRSLGVGEQMSRIARAPLMELAALVQEGNLAGLSDEALRFASDRYLIAAHLERTGIAGSYALQPSLDRIVATGVDEAAASAAAEVALDAHKSRLDRVEATEAALQGIITYIAAALDLPRQSALERVLAA